MPTMRAAVFEKEGSIKLREVPRPRPGIGEALVRVTLTTICGGHLSVPLDAFAAGLGDHTMVTTLCPGGKERMRRLMNVIAARRAPFEALVTHSFSLALDQIEEAYDLFGHQRDGVLKVAIRP
jgi:threonine dehydrogenase-like Zn-dependent dehydrogenase